MILLSVQLPPFSFLAPTNSRPGSPRAALSPSEPFRCFAGQFVPFSRSARRREARGSGGSRPKEALSRIWAYFSSARDPCDDRPGVARLFRTRYRCPNSSAPENAQLVEPLLRLPDGILSPKHPPTRNRSPWRDAEATAARASNPAIPFI